MMTSRIGALLVALFVLAGCGKSPTAPILENGSMSAKIEGSFWAASDAILATFEGGVLSVSGQDETRNITFALVASAPGTYNVSGGSTGLNLSLVELATGKTWQSFFGSGTGSVTITTLSATGTSGTFRFFAPSSFLGGATGNRNVTEGKFDVTF
jgi:hypothetical protein